MAETPIILVLRFRDLTPPEAGNTIKEHSKIASTRGYVWWSWWKKQTEKVPYELWNKLMTQLAKGPGTAFLLDSGQRKLYRTTILQIESKLGTESVPAPEGGDATPPYYNQHSFASWFKLGPIAEVPIDTIRDFAYLEVPHDDLVYFDHPAFQNRQVDGVGQLLQFGNITYWVLTPKTLDTLPAQDVPISRRVLPPIAPRDVVRA